MCFNLILKAEALPKKEPSKFAIYFLKYIILGFCHMKAIVKCYTYE